MWGSCSCLSFICIILNTFFCNFISSPTICMWPLKTTHLRKRKHHLLRLTNDVIGKSLPTQPTRHEMLMFPLRYSMLTLTTWPNTEHSRRNYVLRKCSKIFKSVWNHTHIWNQYGKCIKMSTSPVCLVQWFLRYCNNKTFHSVAICSYSCMKNINIIVHGTLRSTLKSLPLSVQRHNLHV